ncbi:MAG: hypothetical protein L7U66_00580 [Acidimicrobiales bacterium]|nr:hypothetical protein [Acidimicrobiales bacterium]
MNNDRWVVLGLASPRAGWFSELARWSTAAAVPIDFVKCVSVEEVRVRLATGRPYSALLVGGDATGLDRDLIDTTRATGAAVVVIGPTSPRDWNDLGVDRLLPSSFERADLMAVLNECAPPISRVAATVEIDADATTDTTWRGHLVAVTGSGGTGTSTVAMGLAQSLANDASNAGMVVLADFARNGELAMLHDAQAVVPGLQELVEAHRSVRLSSDEIRSMVFDASVRGYHVLLGLRRQRDWTAIRPRALDVSIDGLRRSYRHVVVDVDVDIEGESESGSLDVEERNLIARTTLNAADIVIVVGTATTKGVHSLCRDFRQLHAFGIPLNRLVPVVNRSPRSIRKQAQVNSALASLLGQLDELDGVRPPIHLPERRELDDSIRDGVRLPAVIGETIHGSVMALLDEHGARPMNFTTRAPVSVIPGSLGFWTDEEDVA